MPIQKNQPFAPNVRKNGVIVSSTAAASGASGTGDVAGNGIQITDGTNTATAATDVTIPIELLTVTGDGADTSLILSPFAANEVLAGPVSGSGATPFPRTLVPLDLPVATSSALGIVKPDNSSITIASGVLTAAGAAATNFADEETPGGSINGSNVSFTLAHAPLSGSLKLYWNGVRSLSTDYSFSGSTLTLGSAPAAGDNLIVDYRY